MITQEHVGLDSALPDTILGGLAACSQRLMYDDMMSSGGWEVAVTRVTSLEKI